MAADTRIIWKTEQWGEAPGTEGGTEQTWAHRGADRAYRDPRPLSGMPHSPGCSHIRLHLAHSQHGLLDAGKTGGLKVSELLGQAPVQPQCPAAGGRSLLPSSSTQYLQGGSFRSDVP